MNIAFEINKSHQLAYLSNCNVDERFEKWKREGGTLLENKKLGCGINSLTFLEVFNRTQGEQIVKQLTQGTSFIEMMNYVSLYNNNVVYQEISFRITNMEQIINFIIYLKYFLPNNCCTVAKFNRNKNMVTRENLTDGHSVVLSKTNNNEIITIDPQQLTKRKFEETTEFVEKMIKVWSNQYFETISLIFQPKTIVNVPIQKMNENLTNVKTMPITNQSPSPIISPESSTSSEMSSFSQQLKLSSINPKKRKRSLTNIKKTKKHITKKMKKY